MKRSVVCLSKFFLNTTGNKTLHSPTLFKASCLPHTMTRKFATFPTTISVDNVMQAIQQKFHKKLFMQVLDGRFDAKLGDRPNAKINALAMILSLTEKTKTKAADVMECYHSLLEYHENEDPSLQITNNIFITALKAANALEDELAAITIFEDFVKETEKRRQNNKKMSARFHGVEKNERDSEEGDVYAELMRFYISRNQSDKTHLILETMQNAGAEMSKHVITTMALEYSQKIATMTYAAAHSSRESEHASIVRYMEEFYQQLKQRSLLYKLDAVSSRLLMECFIYEHEKYTILEILDLVLSMGTEKEFLTREHYFVFLKWFLSVETQVYQVIKQDEVPPAFAVLDGLIPSEQSNELPICICAHMIKHGLHVDAETAGLLINTLVEREDVRAVDMLLHLSEHLGVKNTIASYAKVIQLASLLSKRRQIPADAMAQVLEHSADFSDKYLKEHDIKQLASSEITNLLFIYKEAGRQIPQVLLQRCVNSNDTKISSLILLNTALDSALKSGDVEKAKEALLSMKRKGVIPDDATLSILFKHKQHQEVVGFLIAEFKDMDKEFTFKLNLRCTTDPKAIMEALRQYVQHAPLGHITVRDLEHVLHVLLSQPDKLRPLKSVAHVYSMIKRFFPNTKHFKVYQTVFSAYSSLHQQNVQLADFLWEVFQDYLKVTDGKDTFYMKVLMRLLPDTDTRKKQVELAMHKIVQARQMQHSTSPTHSRQTPSQFPHPSEDYKRETLLSSAAL